MVLCHVVERIAAKGDMAPLHADEPEVKAAVEKQAADLRDQGIDTDVRSESVVLGGPARSLADVAGETGADLIVVGTRGHSALAGVILGSVTQKLLHLATCPVLCVRHRATTETSGLIRSSPGGCRRRPWGGRRTRTRPT